MLSNSISCIEIICLNKIGRLYPIKYLSGEWVLFIRFKILGTLSNPHQNRWKPVQHLYKAKEIYCFLYFDFIPADKHTTVSEILIDILPFYSTIVFFFQFNNLPFTSNDENFVEAFAIFCGMGINNVKMYETAVVAMAKQQVSNPPPA